MKKIAVPGVEENYSLQYNVLGVWDVCSFEDAMLVVFMPFVLTRMPGGNCHWQFRSLVLCPLLCVMSVGCC